MATEIPFERHGPCLVALVCLRGQPNRLYHYSKTDGEEESWAVRDYLVGEILRSGDSSKTASNLEAMVTHAERAQFRAVGRIPDWKRDCGQASTQHFGSVNTDTTSKNSGHLGVWRPMNRRGS